MRCSVAQGPTTPLPTVQYLEFGGICTGAGSFKGDDASQVSVSCRTFSSPDAKGAVTAQSGTVDEGSGICNFGTASGQGQQIYRNDGGDELVQNLTDGQPDGAATPLTCHTDQQATAGLKSACDISKLVVPADTPAEAAMLGIQGVCEGANSTCEEFSGLSDAQLADEQNTCQTARGTWRIGTCSLSTTVYTSGCVKHPALSDAPDSTAVTWTAQAVACTQ
jgi:hypothetical protein